jgi:glycosyltransferase involved in cell wall biosynthesis
LKKIDIIHLGPTNGPHPFSRFKVRPFASTADLPYDYEDERFLDDINYDRKNKWKEISLDGPKYNFLEKVFNKFSFYFYKFFMSNDRFPRGVDLYAVRETKIIDDLKKLDYKSDFVFCPMAVESDKFNVDYRSSIKKTDENVIRFLFLGMVSKRKGVHYLIQAFNLLSKKYNNVELIIAGDGAKDTVEDFKKMASGNEKIKFAGRVVGDDRLDYYASCDVFVSDALGQFGLYKVHVEAMAMGKPVILAKYYDTLNVKQDKIGISVEHGNIEELAGAMEEYINNPEMIKEFGISARKWVVENSDFKVLARRTKEAYEKLINK